VPLFYFPFGESDVIYSGRKNKKDFWLISVLFCTNYIPFFINRICIFGELETFNKKNNL
jgi:hypothetical protein